MMRFYTNLVICLYILFLGYNSVGQSVELMTVERLDEESFLIPAECSPHDIIVIINSSITDLRFESNILPDEDFKVIHFEEANQYVICHEKVRFKLTVRGPNLQSHDIDIFDFQTSHVYRITSNVLKGTIIVSTIPGNAIVFLPTINVNAVSGRPITNNSGRYRINILKDSYKTIDTLLTIPSLDTARFTFNLIPDFASIKLDLTTEGGAQFENAPILWIDERKISLDAMIRPDRYKSFFDGVDLYSLYEDNMIPLPPGNYKIRIELPNYIPFETHIYLEAGKVTRLPVNLELVYGYITFIDESNSVGAKVYINNNLAGEVPIFQARTRVGMNTIRLEKAGFMTDDESYFVHVTERSNIDFFARMKVSKEFTFMSEPTAAEVVLNNVRIGFTPLTIAIPAGKHTVHIKRIGYATAGTTIDTDIKNLSKDTMMFSLKENVPLYVSSEDKSLVANFSGLGDLREFVFDNSFPVSSTVGLPYGTYKVTTKNNGIITYKGNFLHSRKRDYMKLPSYSRSSFSLFSADFIDVDNFNVSVGKIHLIPKSGLSTSFLDVHHQILNVGGVDYKTLITSVFLLNWEWRIGGSILRHLDFCFLGNYKYTPGLKEIHYNIDGFHDASMNNFFYGIELSTRLSFINFHCRFGQRTFNGKIHFYETEDQKYREDYINYLSQGLVFSFGIRINSRIEKSNNMARLWYKPLTNMVIDFLSHKNSN